MGSDPLSTILESEDLEQDSFADIEKDSGNVKDEQVLQNADKYAEEDSRNTQTDRNENSKSGKKVEASVSESTDEANTKHESAQDGGTDRAKNKPSEGSKTEGEKKKAKRKDYEKYSITSRADYKIRSQLDAADKLLEQVRMLKSLNILRIIFFSLNISIFIEF